MSSSGWISLIIRPSPVRKISLGNQNQNTKGLYPSPRWVDEERQKKNRGPKNPRVTPRAGTGGILRIAGTDAIPPTSGSRHRRKLPHHSGPRANCGRQPRTLVRNFEQNAAHPPSLTPPFGNSNGISCSFLLYANDTKGKIAAKMPTFKQTAGSIFPPTTAGADKNQKQNKLNSNIPQFFLFAIGRAIPRISLISHMFIGKRIILAISGSVSCHQGNAPGQKLKGEEILCDFRT